MSNLIEQKIGPRQTRQAEFKKRIIPNIPNELLIVNEETIKMPGTAFTNDTIELAKLMQEFRGVFHSAAGDAVRSEDIANLTTEEYKAKIKRMKTLLKEKIARETELFKALEELLPTE